MGLTAQVPGIRAGASVETATRFMLFWATDRVEVFGDIGSLGVVSERDVLRMVAAGRSPKDIRIEELLTRSSERDPGPSPSALGKESEMSTMTDHLDRHHIPYETIEHARAFTAIDEAGELGSAGADVVKVVVLDTSGGHALAVIPATRRLDLNLVRDAVGEHGVRLATEAELQRDFPGYELGAIPPLPSLLGIPAYVDPDVMQHPTIVFAATQTTSIRVDTRAALGPGTVVAPIIRRLAWGHELV